MKITICACSSRTFINRAEVAKVAAAAQKAVLGPLQEVLRCIPKPVLQVENRIDYLGTVTAIYQFLELNLIMVNQFELK